MIWATITSALASAHAFITSLTISSGVRVGGTGVAVGSAGARVGGTGVGMGVGTGVDLTSGLPPQAATTMSNAIGNANMESILLSLSAVFCTDG
ncbi:MAG: hypothetical protein F4Y50_07970 [Dehalococcoidia bacterium]|nr:hypothetical protein [Dehalococcoidia bacterium]